jgi:hypothetical protein
MVAPAALARAIMPFFVFYSGRDHTRLGQPDGISPSRMAEMLEVDKAGQKVRC